MVEASASGAKLPGVQIPVKSCLWHIDDTPIGNQLWHSFVTNLILKDFSIGSLISSSSPCDTQIRRRKRGWIGHTPRKPVSNFTRQALIPNPQEKRKRGRPRNTRRTDTEAGWQRSGHCWKELEKTAQRPVSWRPKTVKWRQFSQSNRHFTIGTQQTEYHEALTSSTNDEVRYDCTFADDGNTSSHSVCRVPMVEWRLDCINCRHLTVVGLNDTGPRVGCAGGVLSMAYAPHAAKGQSN